MKPDAESSIAEMKPLVRRKAGWHQGVATRSNPSLHIAAWSEGQRFPVTIITERTRKDAALQLSFFGRVRYG
jgi:hypothetical protein